MTPTRNHPQTPVVGEYERSDGRAYHRCVEDERERVAGGVICILYSGFRIFEHIDKVEP